MNKIQQNFSFIKSNSSFNYPNTAIQMQSDSLRK